MLQDNRNYIDSQSFQLGSSRFSSLSELKEAAKRYPYSLPIQALLAQALKQGKGFDYEHFIKVSAVLSPNRQWLYNFVHAAPEKKSPGPQEIKPVLSENSDETPEIPVIPVTKVEAEPPVQIQEQIIAAPIEEEPVSVLEIKEVELPQPELTIADDGDIVIQEALLKVVLEPEPEVESVVEPETPAEPQKPVDSQVKTTEPQSQPEVNTPIKAPEPLIIAKNDLLEREILKEAIDKSIQQEVSEIQPDSYRADFVSSKSEEPAQEENPDSFQYWLNPQRKKVESREQKLKKIDALIEKFIKSEPRIVAKKSEFYSPATAAKQSVAVDEDLVSEPLALIFEKQGYFDKAIKAYEKLSLKIPEKRAYFAARIEKIREIVRNIKNNKE